jgi:uncharacterized membrane protein YecN with MAPEG domain
MGPDGSPLEDEPGRDRGPGAAGPGPVRREPYLRRVLADFEAGRIEAYDYTRRVLALNAASSTDAMEAIVGQSPEGASDDAARSGPRPFDAVDLARMRATRSSTSNGANTRYVALAVVFVLFAVLIGIGMWLATHVHGAALSAGPVVLGPRAVAISQGW